MKFRITLKDPDGVSESLQDAAEAYTAPLEGSLDPKELAAVRALREEALATFAGRWVEFGEYLTIELDTDAGTATVVPLKE